MKRLTVHCIASSLYRFIASSLLVLSFGSDQYGTDFSVQRSGKGDVLADFPVFIFVGRKGPFLIATRK
jgi:hypothetical protein